MDSNDWLSKGYSLYMAAVVIISGSGLKIEGSHRHGLKVEAHYRNQPNRSK